MDKDELIECPYNNSHVVVASRMPYHLMKCRKNFPTVDLAVCPFNAIHEVKRAELKYHMLTCPNRVLLEREVSFDALLGAATGGDVQVKKGCTELPRYRERVADIGEEEENWDTAGSNSRNTIRNSRIRTERCPRRPVSYGEAATLVSTRGHLTPNLRPQFSASGPQAQFNFRTLGLGRGRAQNRVSLPASER